MGSVVGASEPASGSTVIPTPVAFAASPFSSSLWSPAVLIRPAGTSCRASSCSHTSKALPSGGAAMSWVSSTAFPSLYRTDHGRAGAVVELDRVGAGRPRRRAPGPRRSAGPGCRPARAGRPRRRRRPRRLPQPRPGPRSGGAGAQAEHLGVAGATRQRRRPSPVSGGSGRIVLMPASTEAAQRRGRGERRVVSHQGRRPRGGWPPRAGSRGIPEGAARRARARRRRVRRRRRHRTACALTRSLSHPHRVPETDQSVPDPGLGRAHRKVEHRGDLRVRVALEVGELQRFVAGPRSTSPTPVGPFVPPSRHVLPRRSSRAPRPGCSWWYVVSRRVLASADRTRSTALRCTIVRTQETALPRAGVEAARGPPDLQEGLLCDLLGLARVADDPHGQPVGTGGGCVVQPGEGRLVPAPRAPEQLGEVAPLAAPALSSTPGGESESSALIGVTRKLSLRSVLRALTRGSDSESGPDRIGDPGIPALGPERDLRLLECAGRGKMIPWPATP